VPLIRFIPSANFKTEIGRGGEKPATPPTALQHSNRRNGLSRQIGADFYRSGQMFGFLEMMADLSIPHV
jgi:hypothetical protein